MFDDMGRGEIMTNSEQELYGDGYKAGYGAAFDKGHDAGKSKAHWELRAWDWKQHTPACGCEPCITAKALLHSVGAHLPDGKRSPSYKIGML